MSNKKKFWFKRKRYGYGWVPSTWQGWLVIVLYMFVVGLVSYLVLHDANESPITTVDLAFFYGTIIIAVAILLIVTRTKGPKPKWRWGKKPDDKSDEDW